MRVAQSNSNLPVIERGQPISLQVNGQLVSAYEGETIAGVLFAEGRRILRHTMKDSRPRSIFCGIGVCYDCLVTVNGAPNVRACVTPVTEGMVIETQTRERK
ncbi:MAG: Hydrogen cyanide synthase subunit HcnA [Anaerolineae bacterium]|nr:Hydrogen cyanide synthase subunit HcnA [Anaerolineae bacterium]